MGICLSDIDHDGLTNMRFADDVLLFASSKEQLQKILCEFKRSTEKVGLRFIQKRRKFSATKAAKARTNEKEMELVF